MPAAARTNSRMMSGNVLRAGFVDVIGPRMFAAKAEAQFEACGKNDVAAVTLLT
jgi:hypothetical protein